MENSNSVFIFLVPYSVCKDDYDKMCQKESKYIGEKFFESLANSKKVTEENTKDYMVKSAGNAHILISRLHRDVCDVHSEKCDSRINTYMKKLGAMIDMNKDKDVYLFEIRATPREEVLGEEEGEKESMTIRYPRSQKDNIILLVEMYKKMGNEDVKMKESSQIGRAHV